MVWDPKRIARVSWAEAAVFYRNLEDRNSEFEPLRALVEHLGSEPWAASLDAATSGTALLVAPPDTTDWATSSVRVDVRLGGSVQLVPPGLPALPGRPAQSPADGLLAKAFERVVREAGWVRTDASPSPPTEREAPT
ncbi:MAG: hypothetical protein ACRENE_01650 [Polyangiaceae bacterium]